MARVGLYYGGTAGFGVVFKLHETGGTWNETVLHSFTDGVGDGLSPIGGLVFGQDGNLYDTTSEGGSSCGCGAIFKMTPMANGTWKEHVIYRFAGSPQGAYPYAGLVVDSSGVMYGATVHGGEDNAGAVFTLKP
jgi:uncharacterized repeat protein (TIGR03803 family)